MHPLEKKKNKKMAFHVYRFPNLYPPERQELHFDHTQLESGWGEEKGEGMPHIKSSTGNIDVTPIPFTAN